jgi:hypothetical protein
MAWCLNFTQVLTSVITNSPIVSDVTPCNLVEIPRRFEGTYWLHLLKRRWLQDDFPKRWSPCTRLHGDTTHITCVWSILLIVDSGYSNGIWAARGRNVKLLRQVSRNVKHSMQYADQCWCCFNSVFIIQITASVCVRECAFMCVAVIRLGVIYSKTTSN